MTWYRDYQQLFGSNLVGYFVFNGTNFVDIINYKPMTKSGSSGSAISDMFGIANKAYNHNNADYWYNSTLYAPSGAISILMTIKFNAVDSYHLITNENSTTETTSFFELMFYSSANKLTLYRWTADSNGYALYQLHNGVTINTDTWYTFIITQNAGSVKSIFNGVYATQSYSTQSMGGGNYGGFTLGGSSALKFNGAIKHMIYWERELSQAEMVALYKLFVTKPTNPLIPNAEGRLIA